MGRIHQGLGVFSGTWAGEPVGAAAGPRPEGRSRRGGCKGAEPPAVLAGALILAILALAGCRGHLGAAADEEEGPPAAFLEGQEAYGRGEYPEAEIRFTRALQADPRFEPAYAARGKTYLRLATAVPRDRPQREYAQRAVDDLSRAIDLEPLDATAYQNRAVGYMLILRFEDAQRDLLHVADVLTPDDPQPHLMLAKLYAEEFDGMEALALQRLDRYTHLGGRDPEAIALLENIRLQTPISPAPGTGPATPAVDRNEQAKALFVDAMRLRAQGPDKRADMMRAVQRLLAEFGDTDFVREERDVIEEFLRQALQTTPETPATPENP